eukprot:TRINITY_DN6706_c0_g1_i2.p1 TRINITY_DN6706_c0_g1~~TRINITY_DN6706_c0_g1_i2.p1  ORF type:complete len:839 (-),score=153.11 TRINITY_DN6706_c0_g1_i2:42-2558(-)
MMLLLLLVSELTSPSDDVATPSIAALQTLQNLVSSTDYSGHLYNQSVSAYMSIYTRVQYEVLYLRLVDSVLVDRSSEASLTQNLFLEAYTSDDNVSFVQFRNYPLGQLEAVYNIILTVCLIIILAVGCLLTTYNARVMVIQPLERMMGLVKQLAGTVKTFPVRSDDNIGPGSGGVGIELEPRMDADDVDRSPTLDLDNNNNNFDTTTTEDGMMGASTGEEFSSGDSGISMFDDDDGEDVVNETDILVNVLKDLASLHQEDEAQRKLAYEARQQRHQLCLLLHDASRGYLARKTYTRKHKLATRRAPIINEVITTERTYCNMLNVAVHIYRQRFETLGVSRDSIDTIFGNIGEISSFHQDLLEQLDTQCALLAATGGGGGGGGGVNVYLGSIFRSPVRRAAMIDLYGRYINNYDEASKCLVECSGENSALADFLAHAPDIPDCKGIPLQGYLITPIQRLPRYVLLLDQLCKNTWPEHGDYASLVEAHHAMQAVTGAVNEGKRRYEARSIVLMIAARLVPPVQELLDPAGPRNIAMVLQTNMKYEGDSFVFMLFSGCNIVVRAKEKSDDQIYEVRGVLHLEGCHVTSILDSPHLGLSNLFQIVTPSSSSSSTTSSMIINARTNETRHEWIEALHHCMNKSTTSTKSPSSSLPSSSSSENNTQIRERSTVNLISKPEGSSATLSPVLPEPSSILPPLPFSASSPRRPRTSSAGLPPSSLSPPTRYPLSVSSSLSSGHLVHSSTSSSSLSSPRRSSSSHRLISSPSRRTNAESLYVTNHPTASHHQHHPTYTSSSSSFSSLASSPSSHSRRSSEHIPRPHTDRSSRSSETPRRSRDRNGRET